MVVVGGAEVGVVREATEGGHSGPLMVNILVVMVAMVVATALTEDMAILLPLSLPMVEGDLMEHPDMIREVRNKSLLHDSTTLYTKMMLVRFTVCALATISAVECVPQITTVFSL